MRCSWWCRLKNRICRKLGTCWELIAVGYPTKGEVPEWVLRAADKKVGRHGRWYGTYYFTGRHYRYKLEIVPGQQGGSWYWYRMRK